MKLTHPDDIDTDYDGPEHPIPVETVERAHGMVEPDISIDALHSHLETVQASLEHNLSEQTGLYDPLDLFGEVVHLMDRQSENNRYSHHLFIEDGRYGFGSKDKRLLSLASQRAVDELNDGDDTENSFPYEEYQERTNNLTDELSLDEFSEDEQKEAFGTRFNIWESVADLLDCDRESSVVKSVKVAHELYYDERLWTQTEHAVTGFVVGVPPMFWSGMHTEQRLFSALTATKMPPAQLIDAYGSRASYKDNSKWGSKRGVSKSSVSQNRSKARKVLENNYADGTYPEGLAASYRD